jgi:uncharacterized protein (TIGR03086 family)
MLSGMRSVGFASMARAVAAAARSRGLVVPVFVSPPRVEGSDRTLRHRRDGSAVVAVRARDRPADAVLADLVAGVLVVNRLDGTAAVAHGAALSAALDLGAEAVAHEARDLARLGVTPERRLGEEQVAVERDLEAPSRRRQQLDRLDDRGPPGEQLVRQTDGVGHIVSGDAELDLQSVAGLGHDATSLSTTVRDNATGGGAMDSVATIQRVIDETTRLVDGVSPGQLNEPTPCTDWTVRDVINHVAGGATMVALSIQDGSVSDEKMGELMGGDNLGDDYKASFRAATARAMEVFRQPGALDKQVRLPFGEMPAAVALNIGIFDVTTHATDIARATGQQFEDTELLQTALDLGRQMIGAEMRQPGIFDAEQPVGEHASLVDQLQAFAGRKV